MTQCKWIAGCCGVILAMLGGGARTARPNALKAVVGRQRSAAPAQTNTPTPANSPAPPAVAPPPFDSFEPITGPPDTLDTPDARGAARDLLRRVFSANIFAAGLFTGSPVPYTAKISYSGSGQVKDVGPGEMDDTQNEDGDRRWIGNIGGFSLSRILKGPFAYDLGSTGLPIPIRLHMVRADVLDITPPNGGSLRTAETTLNGDPINCVLVSSLPQMPPSATGRDWWEAEYCFDPTSGILRVYSAVPGIYYIYDYPNSSSFHEHFVPDRFSVAAGGQVVLQGTISLKDPDANELNPSLFTVTDRMFSGPVRCQRAGYLRILSRNRTSDPPPAQRVIVHAILAADGAVVEAESLQTQNGFLSQSALDLVRKTKFEPAIGSGDPTQREVFVLVE